MLVEIVGNDLTFQTISDRGATIDSLGPAPDLLGLGETAVEGLGDGSA